MYTVSHSEHFHLHLKLQLVQRKLEKILFSSQNKCPDGWHRSLLDSYGKNIDL